jgi:hypothetical protein
VHGAAFPIRSSGKPVNLGFHGGNLRLPKSDRKVLREMRLAEQVNGQSIEVCAIRVQVHHQQAALAADPRCPFQAREVPANEKRGERFATICEAYTIDHGCHHCVAMQANSMSHSGSTSVVSMMRGRARAPRPEGLREAEQCDRPHASSKCTRRTARGEESPGKLTMKDSSARHAFLFDLDGTLVDSTYQHVLA